MKRPFLALDFGGTKLAAAVAWPEERGFRRKATAFTSPLKNAETDRELMLQLAQKVLEGVMPAAIGVSFGGLVQANEGRVILSHHVPGWDSFPLRRWLEELFGVPVAVDNDANMAALGEWQFGAGQGCQSLLYVTVSTGIGGGWVFNGQLYHGADGLAGEIGHMPIQSDGPACTCGRHGCLEALASGPAIARRARERLSVSSVTDSILLKLTGGDLLAITAREVALAAEAGDALALEVLQEAARALGQGIACAIALMNPERVIIGGGVTKSGLYFLAWIREAARKHVLPEMRVDIVQSALGDEAPLYGALILAERLVSKPCI